MPLPLTSPERTEALLDTLLASPGAATAKLDGESAVLLSQSTTSLSSAESALSGARAALEDARTSLEELKTQGVLAGPAKTAREAAVAAVGGLTKMQLLELRRVRNNPANMTRAVVCCTCTLLKACGAEPKQLGRRDSTGSVTALTRRESSGSAVLSRRDSAGSPMTPSQLSRRESGGSAAVLARRDSGLGGGSPGGGTPKRRAVQLVAWEDALKLLDAPEFLAALALQPRQMLPLALAPALVAVLRQWVSAGVEEHDHEPAAEEDHPSGAAPPTPATPTRTDTARSLSSPSPSPSSPPVASVQSLWHECVTQPERTAPLRPLEPADATRGHAAVASLYAWCRAVLAAAELLGAALKTHAARLAEGTVDVSQREAALKAAQRAAVASHAEREAVAVVRALSGALALVDEAFSEAQDEQLWRPNEVFSAEPPALLKKGSSVAIADEDEDEDDPVVEVVENQPDGWNLTSMMIDADRQAALRVQSVYRGSSERRRSRSSSEIEDTMAAA